MAKARPIQASVEVGAPNFSEVLSQVADKVNEIQQTSVVMANVFEVSQSGIDLADVVITSQKASVSPQAMTQVRGRLVQAYQDIMQMPVRAVRG